MLNKQRAALTVLVCVVASGAACLLLMPVEPAPPLPPRGVEAAACTPQEGTAVASKSESAAPVGPRSRLQESLEIGLAKERRRRWRRRTCFSSSNGPLDLRNPLVTQAA